MVLHKFGDRLYEGVTETLQAHLQGVANEVEAQHGVRFLPDLRQRWNDHKNSMQMIRCAARPRSAPCCVRRGSASLRRAQPH